MSYRTGVIIVAIILWLVAMGVAGKMDYDDAVLMEKQYLKMVCQGHWPNYKQIEVKCDQKDK